MDKSIGIQPSFSCFFYLLTRLAPYAVFDQVHSETGFRTQYGQRGFKKMGLNFPKNSRCLDQRHNRVCFWGYHKKVSACFFVGIDVLQLLSRKNIIAEAEMLSIFDGETEKIHRVAARICILGGRGDGKFVYDLTSEDFFESIAHHKN